jgi:capsular polysaccharide export protein
MNDQRSFLFLQGMATRFFARLGEALDGMGYEVHRVNFNGGDWLFGPFKGAVNFAKDISAWPQFLEQRLLDWNVTDIILFGDCRPLHKEAIRVAILRGVRVYVVDEGYIRPNWVTVEQGGVNGNSSLPRDPTWYRNAVLSVPEWDAGKPVGGSFRRRAFEDVAYNFASVLLQWRFPGYRTHRPWHPFVEYAGWLRQFARKPGAARRTDRGMAQVLASKQPFYFYPLQLDCDSQIRNHSSFGRIAPAIDFVMKSFASKAPADTLLVIKEHPLDNALTNWRLMVEEKATAAGIQDRIVYLEGGDLDALIKRCSGVVTVNSTVGFLALAYARPVITLGEAIYDMPDLTFQGSLDAFWTNGVPPDPATFDAFRRVAVARTQVNGGFFSKDGLDLAVQGTIRRLETTMQDTRVPLVPTEASIAGAVDKDMRAASGLL